MIPGCILFISEPQNSGGQIWLSAVLMGFHCCVLRAQVAPNLCWCAISNQAHQQKQTQPSQWLWAAWFCELLLQWCRAHQFQLTAADCLPNPQVYQDGSIQVQAVSGCSPAHIFPPGVGPAHLKLGYISLWHQHCLTAELTLLLCKQPTASSFSALFDVEMSCVISKL